jgi:tetratricopeptide (TPR) repeat protein/tRNA A-37 threonylcarbamoyl transferase component Bud32/TolB-like protein
MNIAGLADFTANAFGEPPSCRCGSAATISVGLCVSCLLRCGLRAEGATAESFDEALAQIEIRDSEWQLGNYQILEEIGRGGMGVIYRARQRHSGRIVALKRVLSYHSDSHETLTRFRREAEAAASLDHANILPIYEVAVGEDGLPFFSMKFAPGGSLLHARTIYRDRPREAVQLVAKVARAIEHAHTAGILHRDVKPGNILLDARGEPLVSDFGLAKWIEATSDLTRTMTVFGTPGYIAPEQVRSPAEMLTAAVDVYSLGAILFDLLSGRPPFVAEHAIAVIHQAAEKQAPRLRSIAPALARDLETICARCLERDPLARYQSAGVLAEDLERWLEDRPISVRPVCAPVRLWRWSRRNRRLAVACAACALLGAIATVRQLQSWHLESAVRKEILAAHSIAVLPFLNLDTGEAADAVTARLGKVLRAELSPLGPAKIVELPIPSAKWTGTGNVDEIRIAADQADTRAVLSGTVRHSGRGVRLSIHLFRETGNDTLGQWLLDVGAIDELPQALGPAGVAGLLYRALDGTAHTQKGASTDAAMKDDVARGYFNAGRALLDRRTIADMDRAINCFEEAVRAAPASVAARSYLALAYLGRNFVTANPTHMERAFAVANQALALDSHNPAPHRALCSLYTSTGQFEQALEHGLLALEAGDPSERALGQIAFVWKELGHPEKAIRWFGKAKVSERQPADYDALLGDCWMLLTEDDQAREAYRAAANFHPDLPEGWLGLCHLQLLNGDFGGARALFRQRAGEYQAFHTVKPLLAQIEFFSRNFAEAERLYREIREADPRGVGLEQYGAISSGSALARLKFAAGDLVSANRLIKECLASDQAQVGVSPHNAEVLYRLAGDEAMQGNVAASVQFLRDSIAAGWLDYRSTRLDPRFDQVAANPEFQKLLSEQAAHVAELRTALTSRSSNGENENSAR